jgi:hypothetical protein
VTVPFSLSSCNLANSSIRCSTKSAFKENNETHHHEHATDRSVETNYQPREALDRGISQELKSRFFTASSTIRRYVHWNC